MNGLIRERKRRVLNQGGQQVNQISIFVLGSVMVLASASAPAQDLTAGKTPAQLFSSDCAECHRSPKGLARNRDVRALASFLREHYTTKSETAGALATYVSGFAGSGAAAMRNRGAEVATPANLGGERPQADRRSRSDTEATGTGEDARTNLRPIQDAAAGRRRRTTNLAGDGEKRRLRNDGEVLRPPGSIVTTPAPVKLNAPARDNAPRDVTEPASRVRSYMSSGLGLEGTITEAGKTGSPKARKRRNHVDTGDSQTPAKTMDAEPPPTALPPATVDATAPRTVPEGSSSQAPPTSPGLEQ
jgi:hypothetical protein